MARTDERREEREAYLNNIVSRLTGMMTCYRVGGHGLMAAVRGLNQTTDSQSSLDLAGLMTCAMNWVALVCLRYRAMLDHIIRYHISMDDSSPQIERENVTVTDVRGSAAFKLHELLLGGVTSQDALHSALRSLPGMRCGEEFQTVMQPWLKSTSSERKLPRIPQLDAQCGLQQRYCMPSHGSARGSSAHDSDVRRYVRTVCESHWTFSDKARVRYFADPSINEGHPARIDRRYALPALMQEDGLCFGAQRKQST